MSRPLRIEYPGAWYHAMNRGRRRERVFLKKGDYYTFIDLLKEASELWSVEVAAFCLMPNHYHLLIHTPKGNLSRFMRHLNGVYTQKFNKKHKFEGQLFKGRFKSILVDGDDYLLQLLRYIHRNPLRAKLVKKLKDFEWGSHLGYLDDSQDWAWLYKDFMLSLFSNNKKNQLELYKDYIKENDKKEVLRVLDGKKWPSFYGSDEFVVSMKEKYYKEKLDKEIPESFQLSPDCQKVKEVVCKFYNIPSDALCPTKRQRFNEPRNVAVYLSRYFTHRTLGQLSTDFNLNSHSSVSTIISGIKKRVSKEKEFTKRLRKMEELCLKRQMKI